MSAYPYRYAIWWENGPIEGVIDPVGFTAPLTADQYPQVARLVAIEVNQPSVTIIRHRESVA